MKVTLGVRFDQNLLESDNAREEGNTAKIEKLHAERTRALGATSEPLPGRVAPAMLDKELAHRIEWARKEYIIENADLVREATRRGWEINQLSEKDRKMERYLSKLEKGIEEAAKHLPALKTLLDYQLAFIRAVEHLQNPNADSSDALVHDACIAAIRNHATEMAKEAGAERVSQIIGLLDDTGFKWHEMVCYLMREIPSINKFICGYVEMADAIHVIHPC
ncbi:MAG: hypothetical protein GX325_10360 [Peptococcaceae bacterium]|nr:hypothetical protein [Peptococcaceae bacterium]